MPACSGLRDAQQGSRVNSRRLPTRRADPACPQAEMTDVKTNKALPYLMGNKTFDVRLGIEREHSFVGFFRSLRMALPVERGLEAVVKLRRADRAVRGALEVVAAVLGKKVDVASVMLADQQGGKAHHVVGASVKEAFDGDIDKGVVAVVADVDFSGAQRLGRHDVTAAQLNGAEFHGHQIVGPLLPFAENVELGRAGHVAVAALQPFFAHKTRRVRQRAHRLVEFAETTRDLGHFVIEVGTEGRHCEDQSNTNNSENTLFAEGMPFGRILSGEICGKSASGATAGRGTGVTGVFVVAPKARPAEKEKGSRPQCSQAFLHELGGGEGGILTFSLKPIKSKT